MDEQLDHFRTTLGANTTLIRVLDRAAGLDLPGWYLLAGVKGRKGGDVEEAARRS